MLDINDIKKLKTRYKESISTHAETFADDPVQATEFRMAILTGLLAVQSQVMSDIANKQYEHAVSSYTYSGPDRNIELAIQDKIQSASINKASAQTVEQISKVALDTVLME